MPFEILGRSATVNGHIKMQRRLWWSRGEESGGQYGAGCHGFVVILFPVS